MQLLILDITTNLDHVSILNKAIGASEYQLYNLIRELSKTFTITCFNRRGNVSILDGITYRPYMDIINYDLKDETIIIQRFMPDTKIYEKIKNNRIFIFNHDLIYEHNFVFNLNDEMKHYLLNDHEAFKSYFLENYVENKNINYVFVSYFVKNLFLEFVKKYNFLFDESRLSVIYNIIYKDEFTDIIPDEINLNHIVYASAWQKGIEHVIKLFRYIIKQNDQLKLVLLSPGYDYKNFESYRQEIMEEFKDRLIVHGPVPKKNLSKIIMSSLCVIGTTFRETFGCIFTESLYLKTPVLVDYRSGAPAEEIVDKNFVINIEKHEETYQKILDLQRTRETMKVELDQKFLSNIELWKQLLS